MILLNVGNEGVAGLASAYDMIPLDLGDKVVFGSAVSSWDRRT